MALAASFLESRLNEGLDGGGAALGGVLPELGASVPVRAPIVPVLGRVALSARASMWTAVRSAAGASESGVAPEFRTKPRI